MKYLQDALDSLATMIFISYSTKNKGLVHPIVKLLRSCGHEVFCDVDNLQYGQEWAPQLNEAIENAERILIFWSKESKKSVHVKNEYIYALSIPGKIIVPILLDKTPLPDELSKYHGTIMSTAFDKGIKIQKIRTGLTSAATTLFVCSLGYLIITRGEEITSGYNGLSEIIIEQIQTNSFDEGSLLIRLVAMVPVLISMINMLLFEIKRRKDELAIEKLRLAKKSKV